MAWTWNLAETATSMPEKKMRTAYIIAEKKADAATREARIHHRQEQTDALDIAAAAGTLHYGAGIDDSM